MEANVPVDGTDPMVGFIAWGLTQAVGRWGLGEHSPIRKGLPYLAVALAVGARVTIDAIDGADLSSPDGWFAVTARAFAAGASAVLAHNALPEGIKAVLDGTEKGSNSSENAE